MMAKPRDKRFLVVLDERHRQALDALAEREKRSRSAIVRDAIDRIASPVPDVEIEPKK